MRTPGILSFSKIPTGLKAHLSSNGQKMSLVTHKNVKKQIHRGLNVKDHIIKTK